MVIEAASEIIEVIVDSKGDQGVEVWEREVIRDIGSRIQIAMVEMESNFEKHIKENPTVMEYFIQALAQIQSIPSFIPKGVVFGKRAQEFLVHIWTIGLQFLDNFVRKHKDILHIDNWSIGATVGFPIGAAGMFSVTFKE